MSFQWLRRALVLAASSVLLAACGGGDVVSQLSPSRIVAFGDGLSDVGQTGKRYTINDGSTNIWTAEVARRYGLTLTAVVSGGTSYATGNARVNTKPDAAGNSATPTVKEQIDTFLAGGTFGGNDLVIVQGGVSDIVAEVARQKAGLQTADQTTANVRQAGKDLGAQVRRVVQAGAKSVVVVGTYNLGKSPWASVTAQVTPLTDLSAKFNEEMLVSIVDLGASVLYVDAAFYLNLVTASPVSYKFIDGAAGTVVCTSVDPGPGIGIGNGQVNSGLCGPSTLIAGIDPLVYLFADPIYLTPQAHRMLGEHAYDRIRSRF